MKGVIERLNEATGPLQAEAEADATALLATPTAEQYRRFLTRIYSFVFPLERSLEDTTGLDRFLDRRRLRKHMLLQHDLAALGMKPLEIESVPQCMWIPWFERIHDALGWAYVIEHGTLAHPHVYRQIASKLPSEGAFASSYLKCYFGAVGEMWRSFGDGLDAAVTTPSEADQLVQAAQSAYRHLKRWRATLDGKSLSNPDNRTVAADDSHPSDPEMSGELAMLAEDG